jgi:hypothetical protein
MHFFVTPQEQWGSLFADGKAYATVKESLSAMECDMCINQHVVVNGDMKVHASGYGVAVSYDPGWINSMKKDIIHYVPGETERKRVQTVSDRLKSTVDQYNKAVGNTQ